MKRKITLIYSLPQTLRNIRMILKLLFNETNYDIFIFFLDLYSVRFDFLLFRYFESLVCDKMKLDVEYIRKNVILLVPNYLHF